MRQVLFVLLIVWPAPTAAQTEPVFVPGAYVGEERYGEPAAPPAGTTWLGLYSRADTSWVQPVEVSVERASVDDMAVHTYQVQPPGPLLLVAGVPGVRAGPAHTSAIGAWLTPGGDGLSAAMGAASYEVAVRAEDPDGCDARVVLSSDGVEQALFDASMEPFSCDEPHFDVQWAGDVDGDERLDLLVDFSLKYSSHPVRLYLSSMATSGALVGLAAALDP